MEAALDGEPRTYRIRRSQHLGYGFIAGSEMPTMVKIIEPNGPSFKKLLPGDVIMAVNGIDVEHTPRETIFKMIQLSQDEIEIKVRQPSYEELIRAKNLADPKFYMFNRSQAPQPPPPLPPLTSSQQHPNCYTNPISPSPSFNKSNTYTQQRQLPMILPGPTTMNRLVTSIAQQQQDKLNHSITTTSNHDQNCTQQEHHRSSTLSKMVLKQRIDENKKTKSSDDFLKSNHFANGSMTVGRKTHTQQSNITSYGRHSPLPQRCKSSMDKTGKKSSDNDDEDPPMLKRSNTMIRPPKRVLEIFEVVIRIFFEDGHTKVLNYNQDTTVSAILDTLNNRLVGGAEQAGQINQYFGLVLTVNSEGTPKEQQLSKKKLLHVLDANDSIMKIRQLPYAPKLRLLYRMIYPPNDVSKLYTTNKVAFDYLYKQSCNDLRLERFNPQLEPNDALNLAALHIVEYVYSNHPKDHGNSRDAKVYMRLVKKTPGLNHFVPASMIDLSDDKKSKRSNYKRLKSKLLEQLKKNFEEFDFEPPKVKSTTNLNRYTSTSFHELSLPGLQSSPSDYVKLLFLNYLSQMPCYSNTKYPMRASASPIDQNSVGDCSSSMESVPRTSDSSPLIKQDRNQTHHSMNIGGLNNRSDLSSRANTISKLAHMNSVRSLSSSIQPPSSTGPTLDQVDMTQTPSIESISEITFNMQSSPSPQQTSSHVSHQSESYLYTQYKQNIVEPSPKPRQQTAVYKTQDYNSIEKLYSQRYYNHANSNDYLKSPIPKPPPFQELNTLFGQMNNYRKLDGIITPILTDRDLDQLRVPPPPRIFN